MGEKYEYKQTTIQYKNNGELNEQLNKFGMDGWNCVSSKIIKSDEKSTSVNVLFKRQIKLDESDSNKQVLND